MSFKILFILKFVPEFRVIGRGSFIPPITVCCCLVVFKEIKIQICVFFFQLVGKLPGKCNYIAFVYKIIGA